MNDLLSYDPITGIITWKVNVNSRAKVGSEAGTKLDTGYRQIRYQGKTWKSHVLGWYLHHRVWPSELDHINHVRDDNRLTNLREVNRSQNNHNCTKPNATGFKGVQRTKYGRFQAMIRINGEKVYLGTFNSPEQAHARYLQESERYFP